VEAGVRCTFKSDLGDGYDRVVWRLGQAIHTRYELEPWYRDSYAAHKRVDRLAGALHRRPAVCCSIGDWSSLPQAGQERPRLVISPLCPKRDKNR
jgi:hypothetical protein